MAETVQVALENSTNRVRKAMERSSRALTKGQRVRIDEHDPLGLLLCAVHGHPLPRPDIDGVPQAVGKPLGDEARLDLAKYLLNKTLPTPAADRLGVATDAEAASWIKTLPSTK